ncbi:MAG TPA: hypothetical protein VII82_06540, partial [Polyangiaceae bacterium]
MGSIKPSRGTPGTTHRTRSPVWLAAAAVAGGLLGVGCTGHAAGGLTSGPSADDGADSGTTSFGPTNAPVAEDDDSGPPGACGSGAMTSLEPFDATPVTASTPPPPISGGTLIVTQDGTKAVASDPDRNAIYVVDLASKTVAFTIALQPGDEPGRLAEDGAGRVHVALRGSGMVVTIDPASGAIVDRRAACPAPRGVAWQASNDTVWVACATGELASLPASGGPAVTRLVERDLRDVVVTGDSLAVTAFRSADVLRLASDGTIARRDLIPADVGFAPHVAWRAIPGPSGSLVIVHQAESLNSLSTTVTGGYGCGGMGPGRLDILPLQQPAASSSADGGPGSGFPNVTASTGAVESVLTIMGSDGSIALDDTFDGVLPVDVAISPDGTHLATVAAGNGASVGIDDVFLFSSTGPWPGLETLRAGPGLAIAVAFAGSNNVLVQTREPAALWIASPSFEQGVDAGSAPVTIPLSTISRDDTGHEVFHTHAGTFLACASCHPEGGDDGHVWTLDGLPRRTPSLRGTIAGTAPYHWSGDEADMGAIVSNVYVVRMSGAKLSEAQVGALSAWIDAIPAPPAPSWVDPTAAAAGRTLFQRTDVGCTGCHSGAKFTNNATVD